MKSSYCASKNQMGGRGVGQLQEEISKGTCGHKLSILKRNASSKLFHNQCLRFQPKPTFMGPVFLNTHLKEEKGAIR